MSEASNYPPDPRRFDVSKRTLFVDKVMALVICVGGLTVILAVFGIFFFILKEITPLFSKAEVDPEERLEAEVTPVLLGVDEWGRCPFLYTGGSELVFLNGVDGTREIQQVESLVGKSVTAQAYDPMHQRVVVGLADGRVGSFRVVYQSKLESDGTRGVAYQIEEEPFYEVTFGQGPVTSVAYGEGERRRLITAIRERGVAVVGLNMRRGMIGAGRLTLAGEFDLTDQIEGEPLSAVVSQNGQELLVSSSTGEVNYFRWNGGILSLIQTFTPFGGEPPVRMDYLFGGVSVAMTNQDGEQKVFSLFRESGEGLRKFGQTKSFESVGKGAPIFASSLRNKSFLCGAGGRLSIRHLTSGVTRWEGEVDFEPVAAAIDGKAEHFFVASSEGQLQRFHLNDPHPESGWNAFWGKVWYEGGDEPVYQWQATGGSDDFEPKLSLVPLVVGSLKGTAYALLFSVPIALLAAIFSAMFLPPSMKRVVKPTMEIMASLPSVVLGFLAGLWLAPIIDDKVPSVLLVCLLLPLISVAFGAVWSYLPIQLRRRFEHGREWLVLIPLVTVVAWSGWSFGPVLEKLFFVYVDPVTGNEIADFRLWWPQATGLSYDQRNSLVVGFAMGFAVIPVIFTIAEDAIANVPKSLTAAAMALGASRWQVIKTISLPLASSGIFSALMIGFGRAMGETMIVVMATGNTPVTEWNIFSGMRTLSANIAVELPEAASGSTHYRTLFLGALVLFLMTFLLNGIAETLRQRLRNKHHHV